MTRGSVQQSKILGAIVVTSIVAMAGWTLVREYRTEPDTNPGMACGSAIEIAVGTTPEFAPILEAAVDRIDENEWPCARYAVDVATAAAAAERIGDGTDAPDVWIPDSRVWIDRANAGSAEPGLIPGATLATTPVVVAVPASQASAESPGSTSSWRDLLTRPLDLRLEDPSVSSPSLVALTSASAALVDVPERDLLLTALVQRSQDAPTEPSLFDQASDDVDGATAVATTEQQVLEQRVTQPESPLSMAVPSDGASLELVSAVLPDDQRDAREQAAIDRLGQVLSGAAIRTLSEETGFQVPAADAATPDGGTDAPSPAAVDAVVAGWDAGVRDVQVLLATDVSASMLEPAGDDTRLGLVAEGVGTALDLYPSTARVGSWSFSSGATPLWTPVVPIEMLETDGDDTQRETLSAATAALADGAGGQTDLYATIRAAYREAQASYRPDAVNAVVLATDGGDAAFDGDALSALLLELQSSADPERPVALFLVGIGPDVTGHELRLIAELTGGRHVLAGDPADAAAATLEAMSRVFATT